MFILAKQERGFGVYVGPLLGLWLYLNSLAFSLRPRFSLFFVISFYLFVRIGNNFKLKYLEAPLLGIDFKFFFETFAANFEVFLNYPTVLVGLLSTFIGIIVLFAILWFKEKPAFLFFRDSSHRVLILFVLATNVSMLRFSNLLSPKSAQGANETKQWRLAHKVRYSLGPFTDFFYSFTKIGIEKPDTLPAEFFLTNAPAATSLADKNKQVPDIYLWLQESTFEPRQFPFCTHQVCNTKMFSSHAKNFSWGPMKVHVSGAGTWTSEFASLTGLDYRLFGAGAYYTNYTLAPKVNETLPMHLKTLGYRTVAIYPVKRFFLNAYLAYRHMGFDAFYDSDALGLGKSWLDISDQKLFELSEKVLKKERLHGKPIFLVMLTIKNHGPHSSPTKKKLPEPFRSLEFKGLDELENTNLANYLHRMNGFKKVFASNKITDDMKNYITGFAVRSNLNHIKLGRRNYDFLDIVYLPVEILNAAQLPKSTYFEALDRLKQRCDGAFMDCKELELFRSYLGYILNDLKIISF